MPIHLPELVPWKELWVGRGLQLNWEARGAGSQWVVAFPK